MTEQKDWLQERVEHHRELAERRAQWEQQQHAEAQERERQQKQDELEAYLRQRGQRYQDTTGSTPPRDVLEGWQAEFLDAREIEAEAERAEKEARAESDIFG